MIKLITPKFEELAYKKELVVDEETMAFNHNWGGTIDFNEDRWKSWYEKWIKPGDPKRFYRYIFSEELNCYVGETAYHYDDQYKGYMVDVIVHSRYRGRGFGRKTLKLLCEEAGKRGVEVLYDNIAIDNPSIRMFLDMGFKETGRDEQFIILKRIL